MRARTEQRKVDDSLLNVFLHALVLLAEIDNVFREIRHHVDKGLGNAYRSNPPYLSTYRWA